MWQIDYIPAELKVAVFLFRYAGIWRPFQNSYRYTLLTIVWFIAIGLLLPFTQFINLYYCRSIEKMVDHFLMSVTCLNGTFKAINVYWQQKNIRKLFELHEIMLNKYNKKYDDGEAFARIRKNNIIILRVFVSLYVTTWALSGLQVIFTKPDNRLWPSTYNIPYEIFNGPKLYLIVLIYQGFAISIFSVWVAFEDTYPVILILLLCGHVDRLKNRLENLGTRYDDQKQDVIAYGNDKLYYHELIECCVYYELCTR